ncbi:MAG: NAD-dependent malic enzyme, partial [Chloroflexi bacterium]|nr:NAD-dependent malic enzyme [Chloroflexota bacterium]
GIGTGTMIVSAMVKNGLSEESARQRCWFMDSKGLIVKDRDNLNEHKRPFAHQGEFHRDLLSAVESIKPTALIGASGQTGAFTKEVLDAMAHLNERPIIFSLSNPTSKTECTAEEAYTRTGGRAIYASGSPFEPVEFGGKTLIPSQGNNVYIYPGVGLGVIACESMRVTDEMFFVAAKTLAGELSQDDLDQGRIYPPLSRIREVSARIATEVARVAYKQGLARKPKPDDIRAYIKSLMYEPKYPNFV